MDEMGGKQGWGSHRQWLGAAILVVLFGVTLVILTIYFAVTANSVACRDGLRAQAECRNTTHLLQRQLTRTQDSLLQAETQANSCNLTVVSLESVPSSGFETAKQVPHPHLEGQLLKTEILGDLRTPYSSAIRGLSILPSFGDSPNFV
jgi:hypothetical protein